MDGKLMFTYHPVVFIQLTIDLFRFNYLYINI